MITTDETTHAVCYATSGMYENEPDSCADFDSRITKSGVFKSYREVWGDYVQPRIGCDAQRPRIDRLLIPTPGLLSAGWKNGIIGVECKASGKKLGPVLSQCLDYSRAAFVIPGCNYTVMCSWIFIWPLDDIKGDMESVMAQNRIGSVFCRSYELLNFCTPTLSCLRIDNSGTAIIKEIKCGKKVGSR